MSRSSHARANMRGGLGVRKRLSEEAMRDTYRLNGVATGSAVARCKDKYGRWEGGYILGVIVRKTASTVQIRWETSPDIESWSQGDARYEVDRGRWKILGVLRGNPMNPEDEMTKLAQQMIEESMGSRETEEKQMTEKQSVAATERANAKKALESGSLQDRETYTAKQIAIRVGTDSKTMRKFFRTDWSTVEPVGQGGRYEFAAADLSKIKAEFAKWSNRNQPKS